MIRRTKLLLFFAAAWISAFAAASQATPIATLGGGQLYRVNYVTDPTITSTGTFDFHVLSTTLFDVTGYLNVVADLNGNDAIEEE